MVRTYVKRARKPWVPKYKPGQVVLAGLIKKPHEKRRHYYWVMCRKCGNDRLVREQKLNVIQHCKRCTGKLNWADNPLNLDKA